MNVADKQKRRSAPKSKALQIRQLQDLSPRRRKRSVVAAITVIAALLAAAGARVAVASASTKERLELAVQLAPGIPPTLAALAMAEVGQAAARGEDVAPRTLRRLETLARRAPLATEPLLVKAALAQRNGDLETAEKLLTYARQRNPRSHAARYLLAELWLRQDRIVPALGEMAILSRLIPASSVQLVPALADYGRRSGARDELRRVIELNPTLKQPLLTALAADPVNSELVLALAELDQDARNATPAPWQPILLNALVDRGQFDRAYAIWQRIAGLRKRPPALLFNGHFSPSPAPPPFNWKYTSGAAGVAEPSDGKLRVIYYGTENAILAEQLVLLPAGRYRFDAPLNGEAAAAALAWTLNCVPEGASVMQLTVGAASAATFAVPSSGCAAQRLQLVGQAQDMARDSDVRIGPVAIRRLAG